MDSVHSIVHALAAERIDRYLADRGRGAAPAWSPPATAARAAIAISRQAGIPGREIGERVAEALGFHVFDREILQAVQEDTHLGERIIEALDAGERSAFDSWIQGFIDFDGRVMDPKSFHHVVSRVIRGISLHGSAVIVGRGAPFVLRGTRALRVRLIAPLEVRIRHVAAAASGGNPVPLHEARDEILRREAERRRFIRKNFRADIDDPRVFDAVFNLREIDIEQAAGLIVDAYLRVVGDGRPA